jgi:hypothetical protein
VRSTKPLVRPAITCFQTLETSLYSTQQQASPDLRYWSVCLSAKDKAKSDDSDPCIADPADPKRVGFRALSLVIPRERTHKRASATVTPQCTSIKDRDGPLEYKRSLWAGYARLRLMEHPRAGLWRVCPGWLSYGVWSYCTKCFQHRSLKSDPNTVHSRLIVLTHKPRKAIIDHFTHKAASLCC